MDLTLATLPLRPWTAILLSAQSHLREASRANRASAYWASASSSTTSEPATPGLTSFTELTLHGDAFVTRNAQHHHPTIWTNAALGAYDDLYVFS